MAEFGDVVVSYHLRVRPRLKNGETFMARWGLGPSKTPSFTWMRIWQLCKMFWFAQCFYLSNCISSEMTPMTQHGRFTHLYVDEAWTECKCLLKCQDDAPQDVIHSDWDQVWEELERLEFAESMDSRLFPSRTTNFDPKIYGSEKTPVLQRHKSQLTGKISKPQQYIEEARPVFCRSTSKFSSRTRVSYWLSM